MYCFVSPQLISIPACDHTFSSRTQNWGWAQFAKRDAVYYASSAVRQADAFTILCTITSSPTIPVAPSRVKKRPVPTAMLDILGDLLDDPNYSDIEFIFPPKRGRSGNGRRGERQRIWANKKLLCRADYFDSSEFGPYCARGESLTSFQVFNSGFSETSASHVHRNSRSLSLRDHSSDEDIFQILDDSDLEEEAAEAEAFDLDENDRDEMTDGFSTPVDEHATASSTPRRRNRSETEAQTNSNDVSMEDSETLLTANEGATSNPRNSEDNSSLSSLEKVDLDRNDSPETVMVDNMPSAPEWPGPPKVRVVVRDVAYTTYRAVLYYVRYFDHLIHCQLTAFSAVHGQHNICAIGVLLPPQD